MRKMIWLSAVSALALAGATSAAAQTQPAAATKSAGADQAQDVQEVVVTAEKREERLVNVPAAITALSGATLQEIGAKTLSDFSALVPGLQLSSQGGGGGQELVLRGLSTGTQEDSALVGEVIDGVPIGSSSTYALGGASTLDSSLWDISRVEVLRGPQGTLYGANAMGGLISYVYNQPDLRRYGGAMEVEGSATQGGSDSWSLRGEVNAPIIADQLALRISAFEDNEGGYIDDPALNKKNINGTVEQGVHAALLWQPNDRFKANLAGIYQHDHRDASDEASYYATTGAPVQGPLDQKYGLLDPGSFDYDEVALTLSYDFGPATLTSISSYEHLKNVQNTVFTDTVDGPLFTSPTFLKLLGVPGPAATNLNFEDDSGTSKYSEELRVTSNGSGPLQYVAGFFTTHEKSFGSLLFFGDGPSGAPLSNLNPGLITGTPSTYSEYAGYAQVGYTFFDRLTITGGLRYNYIDQTFSETVVGPEAAGLEALHILTPEPETSGTETDVSYLADVRYSLTPHSNLYARVATGFRPGGPNVAVAGLPRTFGSDSITDYEAGYKASFFGGRAQFDADVFYIDWNDIQVRATSNGIGGEANGGKASSRGVEAQGSFVPISGLKVGGNVAYVDAHLDQAVPSVGGLAGDPLPFSAKWSGAVFANYVFPLAGAWTGFVGGTAHADSSRNISYPDGIAAENPNFKLEPYLLADIRAGIQIDRYTVTLFIDNVGDSRAELSALSTDELVANVGEVSIARPRTFGVRLDAKF
ncbi:MAG TPA: TonB-dependent receptor [Caulobacteraceae bacterium]|jgi:outer membrane receptor protein involved in Fe transport|nr:TonB-dependent receptor [Caulobacteraceae bacterium]